MDRLAKENRQWRKTFTRENREGEKRLLYDLRHNSADTVAKQHRDRKEGKIQADKARGLERAKWIAKDSLLLGLIDVSIPQNIESRRKKTIEAFRAAFFGALGSCNRLMCKILGHSWSPGVSTKYESAMSPWERQVQASNYPYQYFHRCRRFGCEAENPR